MRVWSRTLSGRLCRVSSSFSENMAEEDNQSLHNENNENNENNRVRTLRDHDTTKSLMSFPKCRSVEVINNPARPGSNHREVNCINYK